MTKDEIIEFLKENLTIDVSTGRPWPSFGSSIEVKVRVLIDGELVAEGSDSFDPEG